LKPLSCHADQHLCSNSLSSSKIHLARVSRATRIFAAASAAALVCRTADARRVANRTRAWVPLAAARKLGDDRRCRVVCL